MVVVIETTESAKIEMEMADSRFYFVKPKMMLNKWKKLQKHFESYKVLVSQRWATERKVNEKLDECEHEQLGIDKSSYGAPLRIE